MAELLDATDLPDDFIYPPEFLRVVRLELTNLEPWWIMQGDLLRDRLSGLRLRYPTRSLIPFARREDNDDVACFDAMSGKVDIIHDFASPGYEQRSVFANFTSWLRQAFEDMLAFE